jgi:Plasmid pRiA4b ORF-3-like protein
MGWTNSHLHSFAFGEQEYTMPYEEGDLEELRMKDERTMCLSELLTAPKGTFEYAYDFGDNWKQSPRAKATALHTTASDRLHSAHCCESHLRHPDFRDLLVQYGLLGLATRTACDLLRD